MGADRFTTPPQVRNPRRIVSLVPSYTQSLIDFGVGDALCGITSYCPQPEGRSEPPDRIGGPKSLDIGQIFSLQPDLILANQEENDQQQVKLLLSMGLPVWLSFPQTVAETLDFLGNLAGMLPETQASHVVIDIRQGWENRPVRAPFRYFNPIWRGSQEGVEWWMTFNQKSYASDVLAGLGGANVFKERIRRYPLAADLGLQPAALTENRDTRYPCVTLEEIMRADPEWILLPDEPYPFTEADIQDLRKKLPGTQAVIKDQIRQLEGRLIHWCGTTIGESLKKLPAIIS